MDDNGKIDSYELTCALTLLSGESLEVLIVLVIFESFRIKQSYSSVFMTMMETSTCHKMN
jgi:hypothetical protein